MVFKSPTIDVPKTKLFSSINKFEVIFAFVNPVTLVEIILKIMYC